MNEKLTSLNVCVGGGGFFKHIKIEVTFVLVLFRVFYMHFNVLFHLGEMVGNNGLILRIKLDFLVTSNLGII